jgi:outer membrane lipoprotein
MYAMKKSLLLLTLIAIIGCAHIISQTVRDEVDMEITPEMLFRDPDAYWGKTVLLGGVIIGAKNTDAGTYIEVVQKPLDYRGKPKDTDISFGRFLVLHTGYLDPAIYSPGRKLTVAGEVSGKRVQPLGEIQYVYPLIKSKEPHIMKPRSDYPVGFSIGIWQTF